MNFINCDSPKLATRLANTLIFYYWSTSALFYQTEIFVVLTKRNTHKNVETFGEPFSVYFVVWNLSRHFGCSPLSLANVWRTSMRWLTLHSILTTIYHNNATLFRVCLHFVSNHAWIFSLYQIWNKPLQLCWQFYVARFDSLFISLSLSVCVFVSFEFACSYIRIGKCKQHK